MLGHLTQPVRPVPSYKMVTAGGVQRSERATSELGQSFRDEPNSQLSSLVSPEKWNVHQFFDSSLDYLCAATVLLLHIQLSVSSWEELLLRFGFSPGSCPDPSDCWLCSQRPNVDGRQRILLLQLCPSVPEKQPSGEEAGLPHVLQHHWEGAGCSTDVADSDPDDRHLL